jgi:signal transduction histidine kinase
MSLRLGTKLSLWSALVVAVAVLLLAGFSLPFLYKEKVQAFDERLREAAHHFLRQTQEHRGDTGWSLAQSVEAIFNPSGNPQRFLEIVSQTRGEIYRSPGLGAVHLSQFRGGQGSLLVQGKRVRMAVVSGGDLTVYYAMDTVLIHRVVGNLGLAYLVALPLVIFVVVVGARFVAKKALAPVERIARAAGQITAQGLGRRLPEVEEDDELGELTGVLNAMLDRLELSFHQASRFSADASHEIKTPVTVLRAGIEDLLHDQRLSADSHSALAALLEQTSQLSSIVESLLLLSRMDACQFKLDLAKQDVVQILEDCLEDAEIMAGPDGPRIHRDLPAMLMVPVDRRRLTQIMLNLLDNAIKYNVTPGRIETRVSEQGEWCEIVVGNTSSARHEEHPERVFERFFRSEHSSEIPGTGLGLSLARELAKAHGGSLTLSRSDGVWTEFKLRLPVQPVGSTRVAATLPTPPSA